MYYNGYYHRAPANMELANDVAKAIDGEYTAIVCYEQLAKLAPSEEERARIMEIRQDEVRHYQTFAQIYSSLTGRKPSPKLNEACPAEYKAGLRGAFKDEQETVDFYMRISDYAADPYIKEAFRRAATDEQNHAVWFLYFLTA